MGLGRITGGRPGKPRRRQIGAHTAIAEQAHDNLGEPIDIPGLDQHAGGAGQSLRKPADAEGHDRHTASHALKGGEREALVAGGNKHHVGVGQQIRDVIPHAQMNHAFRPVLRSRVPGADQDKRGRRVGGADRRPALHGQILPLPATQRPEHRHHRRTGRHAERRTQDIGATQGGTIDLSVHKVRHDGASATKANQPPAPADKRLAGDRDHPTVKPGVQLRVIGVQMRETGDAVERLQEKPEVARPSEMRMEDVDAILTAKSRDPAGFVERPSAEISLEDGHLARKLTRDP